MVFSNAPELGAASLSVSIVTFRPKLSLLSMTLESLVRAVRYAVAQQGQLTVSLWIVDNTPVEEAATFAIGKTALGAVERCNEISVEFIQGHGNVGYGRGHNLALSKSSAEYHLVLNPDVELAEDSLREALRYMAENRAVGVLAPLALDPSGEPVFLCKRYPAVVDLFLRGFAPQWLSDAFRARLHRYELRDIVRCAAPAEVPIASGCFMLCRKTLLNFLGGFSPTFFLYFEDFDLSLRAGRVAKVAYVPAVRIVHHGGQAAGKGMRHIRLFCHSALKFYRAHGWKIV